MTVNQWSRTLYLVTVSRLFSERKFQVFLDCDGDRAYGESTQMLLFASIFSGGFEPQQA